MYSLIQLIKLLIGAIICYAIYVQFSDKMGNIWWRTNHQGIKALNLGNLVHTIISPFKPSGFFLWKYQFWDINFVTFTIAYIVLWKIIYS